MKIYRYDIRQQYSFAQNFVFPDQIYINLTKCMASGINFSTKNTSFHIFYTFVPVWIPPNFHELFHYKLAKVVCDFPCPYQMVSALMLSSEFINFDFSWYIRNVIPCLHTWKFKWDVARNHVTIIYLVLSIKLNNALLLCFEMSLVFRK